MERFAQFSFAAAQRCHSAWKLLRDHWIWPVVGLLLSVIFVGPARFLQDRIDNVNAVLHLPDQLWGKWVIVFIVFGLIAFESFRLRGQVARVRAEADARLAGLEDETERQNKEALEKQAAALADYEDRREADLADIRREISSIASVQTDIAYYYVREKKHTRVKQMLHHARQDTRKDYCAYLNDVRARDEDGVRDSFLGIEHKAQAFVTALEGIRHASSPLVMELPELTFPGLSLTTPDGMQPEQRFFHASDNGIYMEYADRVLSLADKFLSLAETQLENERKHLQELEQRIEYGLGALANARTP